MDGGDGLAFNTVFVDTSLDTHMAIIVSDNVTVSELKNKIVLEHLHCFPNIGEIQISALKVRRKGYFYHLSDSMLVRSAFDGVNKSWFLTIEAAKAAVGIPGGKAGDRTLCVDISENSRKPNDGPNPQINSPYLGRGDVGTMDGTGVVVSENRAKPDIPGGGLTNRDTGTKKKKMKESENSEIQNQGPVIVRPLNDSPPEVVVGSGARMDPEKTIVPEQVQTESPQLKNTVAGTPEKKEKRKYTKRKTTPLPLVTEDQAGDIPPKVGDGKRRKVNPKDPDPSVDRSITPDGGNGSGKMENAGTDPINGCSTEIKPEPGSRDEAVGAEIVNPIVGSKRGRKKKNPVPISPKNTLDEKKAGTRTRLAKSISTDGISQNGPSLGFGTQKGGDGDPHLSNHVGLEKGKADEDKVKVDNYITRDKCGSDDDMALTGSGNSFINSEKNPRDQDDSGKLMKTRAQDKEVGLSAMDEPLKSGAAGGVDSGGMSGSSSSDSDSSEKMVRVKGGQSDYRVALRGMAELKAGEAVAGLNDDKRLLGVPGGGPHTTSSYPVSGGSEVTRDQSHNLLGQGTGEPEKKEKRKYKKQIAEPLPLIKEEQPVQGCDLSDLSDKKRRKVKPKKRDAPDDVFSADPNVGRALPPDIGDGSRKMENTAVSRSSAEKIYEPGPRDAIVPTAIDGKPVGVESSGVGSKKSGKKKSSVSVDQKSPPPENLTTATEPENRIVNSENSKDRDIGSSEKKEKRKHKNRKSEPLPPVTEDRAPVPDQESVRSEVGEAKSRKVKPKKQDVSEDGFSPVPPSGGGSKERTPGKGGKKRSPAAVAPKISPIMDKVKRSTRSDADVAATMESDNSAVNSDINPENRGGSRKVKTATGGFSGSSDSESDISEKTMTVGGKGGRSKVDDYRFAARGVDQRGSAGAHGGGARTSSYESLSASSDTTSTESRGPLQQGIQKRGGSTDTSPTTPVKKGGSVKLEQILRSSSRYKKMKVLPGETPAEDDDLDSQAVM